MIQERGWGSKGKAGVGDQGSGSYLSVVSGPSSIGEWPTAQGIRRKGCLLFLGVLGGLGERPFSRKGAKGAKFADPDGIE
jgi:hypothetical protein